MTKDTTDFYQLHGLILGTSDLLKAFQYCNVRYIVDPHLCMRISGTVSTIGKSFSIGVCTYI